MKSWTRLRCSCGAEWSWWGNPLEAAFLERMWRRAHLGHKVIDVERPTEP